MTDTPRITNIQNLKPRPALVVQYAAIRALFLRELQTRFGHYRLGYLWALIEPSIQLIFFVFVLGNVMTRVMPGIDYSLFMVNGMLPFFVFMSASTRALTAVESNHGLFSYRPVKPIDAVIARTLLETLLYFVMYILFTIILFWMGKEISFSQIPFLLLCWALLIVFTLGFSLILMVIGDFSAEVAKFIGVAFFLLYMMSGIMYSLHTIPAEYQPYFTWNPIVHCLESMRHAVAPAYPVDHIDFGYFVQSTIVVLFIGLLLYRRFERRMLTTK